MIKTSGKANIKLNLGPLKSDLGYRGWVDQFYYFVHSKDRTREKQTWYLLYDLDNKSYCIRSEHTANFNQIALKVATIPEKDKIKEDIQIKDYEPLY